MYTGSHVQYPLFLLGNKGTINFNMKQIMTSITLFDECLFAEMQNKHVPPKGLRNKE